MGRRYTEEQIAFLLTKLCEEKLDHKDKRITKEFDILFERVLKPKQVEYVMKTYSKDPHYRHPEKPERVMIQLETESLSYKEVGHRAQWAQRLREAHFPTSGGQDDADLTSDSKELSDDDEEEIKAGDGTVAEAAGRTTSGAAAPHHPRRAAARRPSRPNRPTRGMRLQEMEARRPRQYHVLERDQQRQQVMYQPLQRTGMAGPPQQQQQPQSMAQPQSQTQTQTQPCGDLKMKKALFILRMKHEYDLIVVQRDLDSEKVGERSTLLEQILQMPQQQQLQDLDELEPKHFFWYLWRGLTGMRAASVRDGLSMYQLVLVPREKFEECLQLPQFQRIQQAQQNRRMRLWHMRQAQQSQQMLEPQSNIGYQDMQRGHGFIVAPPGQGESGQSMRPRASLPEPYHPAGWPQWYVRPSSENTHPAAAGMARQQSSSTADPNAGRLQFDAGAAAGAALPQVAAPALESGHPVEQPPPQQQQISSTPNMDRMLQSTAAAALRMVGLMAKENADQQSDEPQMTPEVARAAAALAAGLGHGGGGGGGAGGHMTTTQQQFLGMQQHQQQHQQQQPANTLAMGYLKQLQPKPRVRAPAGAGAGAPSRRPQNRRTEARAGAAEASLHRVNTGRVNPPPRPRHGEKGTALAAASHVAAAAAAAAAATTTTTTTAPVAAAAATPLESATQQEPDWSDCIQLLDTFSPAAPSVVEPEPEPHDGAAGRLLLLEQGPHEHHQPQQHHQQQPTAGAAPLADDADDGLMLPQFGQSPTPLPVPRRAPAPPMDATGMSSSGGGLEPPAAGELAPETAANPAAPSGFETYIIEGDNAASMDFITEWGGAFSNSSPSSKVD